MEWRSLDEEVLQVDFSKLQRHLIHLEKVLRGLTIVKHWIGNASGAKHFQFGRKKNDNVRMTMPVSKCVKAALQQYYEKTKLTYELDEIEEVVVFYADGIVFEITFKAMSPEKELTSFEAHVFDGIQGEQEVLHVKKNFPKEKWVYTPAFYNSAFQPPSIPRNLSVGLNSGKFSDLLMESARAVPGDYDGLKKPRIKMWRHDLMEPQVTVAVPGDSNNLEQRTSEKGDNGTPLEQSLRGLRGGPSTISRREFNIVKQDDPSVAEYFQMGGKKNDDVSQYCTSGFSPDKNVNMYHLYRLPVRQCVDMALQEFAKKTKIAFEFVEIEEVVVSNAAGIVFKITFKAMSPQKELTSFEAQVFDGIGGDQLDLFVNIITPHSKCVYAPAFYNSAFQPPSIPRNLSVGLVTSKICDLTLGPEVAVAVPDSSNMPEQPPLEESHGLVMEPQVAGAVPGDSNKLEMPRMEMWNHDLEMEPQVTVAVPGDSNNLEQRTSEKGDNGTPLEQSLRGLKEGPTTISSRSEFNIAKQDDTFRFDREKIDEFKQYCLEVRTAMGHHYYPQDAKATLGSNYNLRIGYSEDPRFRKFVDMALQEYATRTKLTYEFVHIEEILKYSVAGFVYHITFRAMSPEKELTSFEAHVFDGIQGEQKVLHVQKNFPKEKCVYPPAFYNSVFQPPSIPRNLSVDLNSGKFCNLLLSPQVARAVPGDYDGLKKPRLKMWRHDLEMEPQVTVAVPGDSNNPEQRTSEKGDNGTPLEQSLRGLRLGAVPGGNLKFGY